MAKRIVNKAERNAERYDAKETGYRLFEDSQNGKTFDRLMPLIVSEQNIILAYRNICKNSGSKTPGTDGKTIVAIQSLPIESVIKTVRNKLNYYQPKKVRRVEIPKDNGKTRPLGIPSIWDRLIQQCILQILEPICEVKFHERKYFQDEEAEPRYQMAGKEITPKLLLEAIRTLPEEKRTAILLYYFEGMTDVEIGKMFNTSRSTIQYRRTSSFELLKKYLEGHADEWEEW